MHGYRELWQQVVTLALRDALHSDPGSLEDRRAKRDAIRWFEQAGRDFREVCTLAGLDPDAVHSRWKAGTMVRPFQEKVYQRKAAE